MVQSNPHSHAHSLHIALPVWQIRFLAGWERFAAHPPVAPLTVGLLLLCLLWLPAGCSSGSSSSGSNAPMVAQSIENKGSDTLVNLALAWAEAYVVGHSDMRISRSA